MVVSAGRLTEVVVVHTPDGPWRLAIPEGARSHSAASGRLCTK